MLTSGGKASFIDLDLGRTFSVQYNPKEFKVDKAVSWKEHDDQGQTNAGLEFQKGAPLIVTMELLFDTTHDGSDVRNRVQGLMAFTNADVPATGEGADKKRPPRLQFTWGSFTITCVIESLNVSYVMFSSSGHPIRARVSLKLKEWDPKDAFGSGGGSGISGAKVKLVTAGAGATASSLAAQHGSTSRQIMSDNNIEDGMEIPAGTEIKICDPTSGPGNVSSNRNKSDSDSPFQEIQDAIDEVEKIVKEVDKAKKKIEEIGRASCRERV